MSRESELAWAAGFFDGEGSTFFRRRRKSGGMGISISQKERTTLDRFHAAVGGMGVVVEYDKAVPFSWTAYRLYEMEAVLSLLWPYLSQPKRQQAMRAFAKQRWARQEQARNRHKPNCKRGHPLSGANLYLVEATGFRRCRICDRTVRSRRTARTRNARFTVTSAEAALLTAAGYAANIT